jgi:hypothetical protein
MADDLVPFDLREAPRAQRITHAHVGDGAVTFHTHPVGQEEEQDPGITLDLETLRAIAGQFYWKRPGVVEVKGQAAGTIPRRADCQIGYVVLEGDGFREVVSAPSIALIVAVLQGRREAERRKAMMTHQTRVSKHLGGTYP